MSSTRLGLVGLIAAATLTLAGCTNDPVDESPAPPKLSAEEQDQADIEETLTLYIRALDDAFNGDASVEAIYLFSRDEGGNALKDRVVAGERVTTFGEFQIHKSIMVPRGKIFLLPDPNFLGVFPVKYSLDVEENNRVESFWRGWVFDEMVNMTVLNPRGIATITKADVYTG